MFITVASRGKFFLPKETGLIHRSSLFRKNYRQILPPDLRCAAPAKSLSFVSRYVTVRAATIPRTASQNSSWSAPISRSQNDLTHAQFLISAGVFEGGMLAVAFAAGWVTGIDPTASLRWNSEDFLFGLTATIPMLLLLVICMLSSSAGMTQIRKFLRDTIGIFLVQCRPLDLLLLALLAGVCEEIFFRGFLYAWISDWNPVLAVMVTNLLFGLAHAVTPVYAMLAAFLGLYLTALVAADSTPNLLIPLTAHSLYDLIAFYVVIYDYRRHEQQQDSHPG